MAQIQKATVKRRSTNPTPQPTPSGSLIDTLSKKPGVPEHLRGVLFGPPKTGKTTAACSGESVLLMNFDPDGSATMTLKGREDVTVVEPKNWQQIQDVIKELHTTAKGRFRWVVVDSLSFLFQLLGGKDINDTYLSGKDIRRAYGQAGAAVNQIINDLCALDAHVIFCAHLANEDTDDGVAMDTSLGETEVKVAVTPMVWKLLGPAVGFIGRTYRVRTYEREEGAKKATPVTKFMISFNDGEKSPAGSRYEMEAEYEITPSLLKDLEAELQKGA